MNDSEKYQLLTTASLLSVPTAVGGIWAVLDPAKSLFSYIPPLQMLMGFQTLPRKHTDQFTRNQFHKADLSASDGLKQQQLADNSYAQENHVISQVHCITYSFEL